MSNVKPLEWRHEPIPPAWEWIASSTVGLYCIPGHLPAHTLRFRDKDVLGEFPTIEAAKAAAQADYEQRILSALTNTDLSLRAENEILRAVVSKCADALGNGAFISPKASVEFMEKLPGEITSVITKSKAKLEEAAKVLEPFAMFTDWPLNGMADDTPVSCRVYSASIGEHPIAGFGLRAGEFRAAKSFLENLKGAE